MSDLNEQEQLTEEEIDAQIAERNKGKKRGRPKNTNYLPWSEAREYMRGELLPSRGKFFEWWDREKPKAIPRFPYRVYQDEWTSWNDFLGTNNKFNEKMGTKWRPLVEGTAFAHSLGLKSMAEWMEWAKVEGNLPADIPARPDLVYDQWRTWAHWLGNRVVQAVEAKREVAKVQLYYIVHEPDDPQNVLHFGIEPMGLKALKDRWESRKFNIVKVFWYDQGKAQQIKEIVDALSSPYQESMLRRLVPNVWEIVYYLQMQLETVTREQMANVT